MNKQSRALTEAEAQIHTAVCEYYKRHGHPPFVSHIAGGAIVRMAVRVQAIVRKGWLGWVTIHGSKSRAIVPTRPFSKNDVSPLGVDAMAGVVMAELEALPESVSCELFLRLKEKMEEL